MIPGVVRLHLGRPELDLWIFLGKRNPIDMGLRAQSDQDKRPRGQRIHHGAVLILKHCDNFSFMVLSRIVCHCAGRAVRGPTPRRLTSDRHEQLSNGATVSEEGDNPAGGLFSGRYSGLARDHSPRRRDIRYWRRADLRSAPFLGLVPPPIRADHGKQRITRGPHYFSGTVAVGPVPDS
jgi:hypothetical protein